MLQAGVSLGHKWWTGVKKYDSFSIYTHRAFILEGENMQKPKSFLISL